MRKTFTYKITNILVILFSIALALGTWNPLVAYNPQVASSSFDLSQIISVLFIFSLIPITAGKHLVKISFGKELAILFLAIFSSTIFNSISALGFSDLIFFIKLALVMLLCYLLPRLFLIKPEFLYRSMLFFSITCAIISIWFFLGGMSEYIILDKGRVSFWGENPNSTSARFVAAFLFLLHFIISEKKRLKKYRFLLLLPLPLVLNLIMATGSRGSFLILLICTIIYLAFLPFRNSNYKIVFAFVIPVALYFSISYFARTNQEYSLLERLNNSIELGEDAGRAELNKDAFNIFIDHPLIGVGEANFQDEMVSRYNEERTVHNLYLYLLAVSGIIGFITFFVFLYRLFIGSIRIRRLAPIALTLLIYIFLLSYKTGGILTYMLMWYIFAIIIALINSPQMLSSYDKSK